jgi:murein DD-endopeptidase MepM/ murein hydrolase activator NlpD
LKLQQERRSWDDETGTLWQMTSLTHKASGMLNRVFPEQRLYLRSDAGTRYIRLSPLAQLVAVTGSTLTVSWAIIASAVILMDSIGAGSLRDQARRDQEMYETRLNTLAAERDTRAGEASAAQQRFNTALGQVSLMQSELLASEDQRRELEIGIEVIQSTLRRTMGERDIAIEDSTRLAAALEGADETALALVHSDLEATIDTLSDALSGTAEQRDDMALFAEDASEKLAQMDRERRLLDEKNDRIFGQLEDAVTVSLTPLDKMFRAAGMPTEKILDTVRRGYSGQGGPLMPISFSTKGEAPDTESLRANGILDQMDNLNLYRIAAQKAPFASPIKTSAYRMTSGFGPRWGRIHKGTDFAAAYGTPIYATGDGVVTYAGWSTGYGWLVKIEHEFGYETRFAHNAKLRVKVGQRVSRGQQISDMGNSGRSTGTHVHYEVRLNGTAVNPMTYIKAAKNVF